MRFAHTLWIAPVTTLALWMIFSQPATSQRSCAFLAGPISTNPFALEEEDYFQSFSSAFAQSGQFSVVLSNTSGRALRLTFQDYNGGIDFKGGAQWGLREISTGTITYLYPASHASWQDDRWERFSGSTYATPLGVVTIPDGFEWGVLTNNQGTVNWQHRGFYLD